MINNTSMNLRRMFNSEIIIENRDVRKEDSNQFSLIRENQDEGHISKTKNGENIKACFKYNNKSITVLGSNDKINFGYEMLLKVKLEGLCKVFLNEYIFEPSLNVKYYYIRKTNVFLFKNCDSPPTDAHSWNKTNHQNLLLNKKKKRILDGHKGLKQDPSKIGQNSQFQYNNCEKHKLLECEYKSLGCKAIKWISVGKEVFFLNKNKEKKLKKKKDTYKLFYIVYEYHHNHESINLLPPSKAETYQVQIDLIKKGEGMWGQLNMSNGCDTNDSYYKNPNKDSDNENFYIRRRGAYSNILNNSDDFSESIMDTKINLDSKEVESFDFWSKNFKEQYILLNKKSKLSKNTEAEDLFLNEYLEKEIFENEEDSAQKGVYLDDSIKSHVNKGFTIDHIQRQEIIKGSIKYIETCENFEIYSLDRTSKTKNSSKVLQYHIGRKVNEIKGIYCMGETIAQGTDLGKYPGEFFSKHDLKYRQHKMSSFAFELKNNNEELLGILDPGQNINIMKENSNLALIREVSNGHDINVLPMAIEQMNGQFSLHFFVLKPIKAEEEIITNHKMCMFETR